MELREKNNFLFKQIEQIILKNAEVDECNDLYEKLCEFDYQCWQCIHGLKEVIDKDKNFLKVIKRLQSKGGENV